jgi:hypothetical protein
MGSFDAIVSLCKQRGFVFQSSEIYGGIGGFWDYGPLGVELKNNIKRSWWRRVVQMRDDVVGLDAAIIMNPQTWVASGHVEEFTDPLIDCKQCKKRFRADAIVNNTCPECGAVGQFTDVRKFNLMFKTYVGPGRGERSAHLSAPRDRPGDLRELSERPDRDAQEAPLRDRPDRQGVSERDHARGFHLPRSRIRADGDRILCQARHRRAVAPALGRGATPMVHRRFRSTQRERFARALCLRKI